MTHFLVAAISIATVLLYGCVGEIITEKAGHLNLGIPGIMCMGTAGGCFGVSIYMGALSSPDEASWILLVLISLLFSALVFNMKRYHIQMIFVWTTEWIWIRIC